MNGYLLDTMVVSDLAKFPIDPRLDDWAKSTPGEQQFLSVMTLGEMASGIEDLPDGRRRRDLELWLQRVLASFESRILSFDQETAMIWGRKHGVLRRKGVNAPAVDLMLAASALRHGLTVVTRNTRDFARFEVPLLNPWR